MQLPFSISGQANQQPKRGCLARTSKAFTLIELLVVISIIALLASMLIPVLARAKRSAHSTACLSNLHQLGLALELYIQENDHRLPVCAAMPSVNTNLTPITKTLAPYLRVKDVFKCPADHRIFETEQTSYEWNLFLNGASYDRPEDWLPETQVIVRTIFGGRLNTPLMGDAEAVHQAGGVWSGKNALYFEGRVQRARTAAPSSKPSKSDLTSKSQAR